MSELSVIGQRNLFKIRQNARYFTSTEIVVLLILADSAPLTRESLTAHTGLQSRRLVHALDSLRMHNAVSFSGGLYRYRGDWDMNKLEKRLPTLRTPGTARPPGEVNKL